MEIRFLLYLLLFVKVLSAQSKHYYTSQLFQGTDLDSTIFIDLDLERNGRFSFVVADPFICTQSFLFFGKGIYNQSQDTLLLKFDSIPTLASSANINMRLNEDELTNLAISVFNEKGHPMNGLDLLWGKPQKKGRWMTSKFFSEKFNTQINIEFDPKEVLDFIRLEKPGYYSYKIDIDNIRKANSDAEIKITLRPKPTESSAHFISNYIMKVPIQPDCSIEFSQWILKAKNCN